MVDVFLTIDTECSLGGAWTNPSWEPVPPERAIVGKVGGQYYGTPLIMDILEKNGLRGTFFLEVLSWNVVPDGQLADAYGQIVSRGHDVQLHLHPVYHYYHLFRQGRIRREELPANMDLIGTLPREAQRQLLVQGTELFRRLTGKTPVAFRAGSFGGSASTLGVLAELGFAYDSSFNAAYLGNSCLLEAQPSNTPWHDGVWELPITNFRTGSWKMRGFKPLDVAGVSFFEIRRVLQEAERLGLRAVVLIMHSFTLFKRSDVQFRRIKPDHLVIRRFSRLCEFLKNNASRFRAATFGEKPKLSPASNEIPFPELGTWLPLGRKIVQAVNRAYWV